MKPKNKKSYHIGATELHKASVRMKYYVYPNYEVYESPPEYMSDDYMVIEAATEEDALSIYVSMEDNILYNRDDE